MAVITSEIIQAYANYFLPQFYFAGSEQIFPVSVDSWLQHCADGDWQAPTDPHRGTTVVGANLQLSVDGLTPDGGCRGESIGMPIDPTVPLPIPRPDPVVSGGLTGNFDELFIDFAGWNSLQDGSGSFTVGGDDYIREFFSPYFGQISQFAGGLTPPPTRTRPPILPANVAVYCEATWAGDYTRLSIRDGLDDFASGPVNVAGNPVPDQVLDKFFVLSYYLFYPCTEPPPSNSQLLPGSINLTYREGQWEAVSLYFSAGGNEDGPITDGSLLELDASPIGVIPDFVVLSQGITVSGDGKSPQIAGCYPAEARPAKAVWLSGNTVSPFGLSVYVTSGTHKNRFESTSPFPGPPQQDPNQEGLVLGSALEGVGGIVAGTTGGTGVGLVFGLVLWFIGLLISVASAEQTSPGTPVPPTPDGSGDIANSLGPSTGPLASSGDSPPSSLNTDLAVFSYLPIEAGLPLPYPSWWSFPGRWGVAMNSKAALWDSGGRLTDFQGRTRAYWNTVALQNQIPYL